MHAIKLNIGVTIATNICIFLFLVQECLALWLSQLEGRGQGGQVKQVEAHQVHNTQLENTKYITLNLKTSNT